MIKTEAHRALGPCRKVHSKWWDHLNPGSLEHCTVLPNYYSNYNLHLKKIKCWGINIKKKLILLNGKKKILIVKITTCREKILNHPFLSQSTDIMPLMRIAYKHFRLFL